MPTLRSIELLKRFVSWFEPAILLQTAIDCPNTIQHKTEPYR
jgi:hypothetical protein